MTTKIQPNAIDLALDALRQYEMFADVAANDDRPVRREIAAGNAGYSLNRANVLAKIAIAQAIVALTNTVGDGLLAELVRTDADNAALIERLRIMPDEHLPSGWSFEVSE